MARFSQQLQAALELNEFYSEVQVARELFNEIMHDCMELSESFWELASFHKVRDPNQLHLEGVRDSFYNIERKKAELEQKIYTLRQQIIVPDIDELGKPILDELGNQKIRKDLEREAWLNWLTFAPRSAFLGLQNLFARFLFAHQPQLLPATFKREPSAYELMLKDFHRFGIVPGEHQKAAAAD